MVSSLKFTASALVAFACLIAIGCSGSNYDSMARLPNRPPFIVPNSLTWSPADTEVQRDIPYLYSVRAIDPDIGDRVVKYWWRFGDGECTLETIETDDPSVSYIFGPDAVGGVVSVKASDNRLAAGAEESFPIPLSPIRAL